VPAVTAKILPETSWLIYSHGNIHRLVVSWREGRRMIENPVLSSVRDIHGHVRGYIMTFRGADGKKEHIGNLAKFLPVDVMQQALTNDGLEIIFADMTTSTIKGGQLLFLKHLPDEYYRDKSERLYQPQRKSKGSDNAN